MLIALFLNVLAAALWGYGFLGQRLALEGFGPVWVTSLRFALGCVLLCPIILFSEPVRLMFVSRKEWKRAFFPSVFLLTALIFQTWGLQYTTLSKSGFITCLYVLLLPPLEKVFLKRDVSWVQYVLVLVALVGTALLTDFRGGDVNFGDFLTLVCAVCSAAQVLTIAAIAPTVLSPGGFALMQMVWCALLSLPFAFALDNTAPEIPTMALVGLGTLALGPTALAFLLQMVAQRTIRPSTAALIWLLEAPFAALLGYLVYEERLSFEQWVGALIILGVAAATIGGNVKYKGSGAPERSPAP